MARVATLWPSGIASRTVVPSPGSAMPGASSARAMTTLSPGWSRSVRGGAEVAVLTVPLSVARCEAGRSAQEAELLQHLVDARRGDREGGEEERGREHAARAQRGIRLEPVEVEGGVGEEGEHQALADRSHEHERDRVAEDEEDGREGRGQEDRGEADHARLRLSVLVAAEPEDREAIGEEARVRRRGPEHRRVEDGEGPDEEDPQAPLPEGLAVHVRERLDHVPVLDDQALGVEDRGPEHVEG